MLKEEEKKDIYVYAFEGKPYFNLTNRCCNACTFCIRNNADGVKGNRLWLRKEPTAAEAIAQLTQLEKEGMQYDEAVFCGYGEPTSALNVMLEVAQELSWGRDKKTRLNTNGLGSLIHGYDIVPSLKGKIDEVSVSLNAATAEEYVQICKPQFGLAAYKALWDFSKACAREKISVTMTVVDVIGQEGLAFCRSEAEKAGIRFRVRHYITDNEKYE